MGKIRLIMLLNYLVIKKIRSKTIDESKTSYHRNHVAKVRLVFQCAEHMINQIKVIVIPSQKSFAKQQEKLRE